ncbi:MAG: hypothetical protein ABW100_07550 [Candidatus Thiodiazotropha sp. 6PLUC3]
MRRKITASVMQLLAILGLVAVAETTYAAIIDFSSGTFLDRSPGTGVDYYSQDGYIVEIANPAHNTDMTVCPNRWCFDNIWRVPAETTFITRADGGAFDLTSLQNFANTTSGVNFSADSGAFLNSTDFGTISFDTAFQDITLLRMDIPCGFATSCGITLDNIDISPVPIPAAVWLFGSGLLGLIGFRHKREADQA